MSFLRQLHKIARLEEAVEKLAGEGAGAPSTALLKAALWAQMKAAAATEPGGAALGLAKLAARLGAEAQIVSGATNEKTASERLDADLLAVGFATALAVDWAIEKQAAAGWISADDARSLGQLNAESAVDELLELAKTAAPAWLTHPSTIGAGLGAAAGAGLGAWNDADNRLRGGAMGALGGAAVGGLGGLAVQHWRDAAAAEGMALRKAQDEAARAAASNIRAYEGQRAAEMADMVNLQRQMQADAAAHAGAAGVLPDTGPTDVRSAIMDALHEAMPGAADKGPRLVYHATPFPTGVGK